MIDWRFLAEVEANPTFLQELGYWILQSLIATLPLAGLSVILHRAGRKGLWPTFPWALAALCGPTYNMIRFWLSDDGFFSQGYVLGLVSAWASGAYIALCLSVVLFAVIGLNPPPLPPED